MAEHPPTKKPSINRTKLALIPALLLVLVYLIYAQMDDAPVDSPGIVSPDLGLANLSTANSTASSTIVSVTWPTTPLTEVLAVNPFKLPTKLTPVTPPIGSPLGTVNPTGELARSEEARLTELREAIRDQRLQAIIQTTKGIGAIVDDTIVGGGDTVGDRLRVKEIRSNEVVFELISEPEEIRPKTE